MKHSLLGTRRVISSIITRNFIVTRNKQPMTIGTNRMCISRDDNCVNTMCFPRQLPTTARKFFTTICFRCFLRRVWYELSYSYRLVLFSFLLCDEFLKAYFLSMPQLSKYVSIRPNERFRKVLWRGLRYSAKRNETKRNETNLIDKEITVHRVSDTTKIYSFSSKPVLARCLVSQNTNNGRLVIDETSFADNFFSSSAPENYLAR